MKRYFYVIGTDLAKRRCSNANWWCSSSERIICETYSKLSVVCLAICSCNKNDNKVNDLVPVEETPGTDNIQVSIVDITEGKDITVKIKNLSDEVFLYCEYYSIQILVDGNWFYAPTVEDVVVHDLAHELSPGASYTMTYSLLPYGELDNGGHYRIACCDMGNKANIYYDEFIVWKTL